MIHIASPVADVAENNRASGTCLLAGGHDFAVFYEAWNLVAHGRGTEIYTTSPDRFLYAPGFAPPRVLSLATVLVSILVVWKHRENMQRLIAGTESKLKLKL